MNYQTWLTTIPKEFKEDALWKINGHLLRIIPAERGHELHEDSPPYLEGAETITLDELLTNVPLPPDAT